MGSEDVFAQDLTLIHSWLPLAITLGRQHAGAVHSWGFREDSVYEPEKLKILAQSMMFL